ncbi:MAG: KamA family radical SAM protein [Aquificae bacterium]|jgi:KamA family protein|nr:KamA family radical SAM protein [Aquificota bacterium]
MPRIEWITDVEKLPLSEEEKKKIKKVTEFFPMRLTSHYMKLIDWNNPNDPLRKIAVPFEEELQEWGYLDPSNEKKYTVAPGLQHKYKDTALFLIAPTCLGFCRFCFRKRLFIKEKDVSGKDILLDLEQAFRYIEEHPEINNVLLTGGDPLVLPTEKLEEVIARLRQIPHVKIIRIGTKSLAYYPQRVLEDPDFLKMIEKYSLPDRRIYIMNDFNHPREISRETIEAVDKLIKAGAILTNQTPLLRGVNDNPSTLRELFEKLSFIGIPPYYVFINRPVKGNKAFAIPVEEALTIFEQAKIGISGLAERAKLVMSHATGKIEVVGMDDEHIYFKYHRAADEENAGKFLVFKRNPNAYWFDDYTEKVAEYSFKTSEVGTI